MIRWDKVLEIAGLPTQCRVLDCETYTNSDGYSLTKLPVVSYVRDPRFKLLGIAQMAFNQSGDYPAYFHTTDAAEFLERGQDHWENGQEVIVCHNARFDCSVLRFAFGIAPKFIIDTLSMARVIWPRCGNSLREVAERLGLPPKLDYDLTDKSEPTEEMGVYSRRDAELTATIAKLLLSRLSRPAIELALIAHTIRSYTNPILMLDPDRAKTMLASLQSRKTDAENVV